MRIGILFLIGLLAACGPDVTRRVDDFGHKTNNSDPEKKDDTGPDDDKDTEPDDEDDTEPDDEGETSPGEVNGSVAGQDIVVREALAFASPYNTLEILLFERQANCELLKSGFDFKDQWALFLGLVRLDGLEAYPVTAGEYRVLEDVFESGESGPLAEAGPTYYDDKCAASFYLGATSGLITVEDGFDEETGKPVVGTFTLEFPSGDALDGNFNATWCDFDDWDDLDC